MKFRKYFLLGLSLSPLTSFAQESTPTEINLDSPILETKKEEKPKSSWDSITPSLDSRYILLLKESPSSAGRQGFSVMQAILGLDFQISPELSAVTRYNLGFLGTGPRDIYLDFQSDFFENIRLGRFNLDFGNRISDHRVYAKRFFGVSINDFETGIQFSKSMGSLHATLSVTQNPGGGEAFQGNEFLLSPALDLRWDFSSLGVDMTLGASALKVARLAGASRGSDNNSVASIYGEVRYSSISLKGEIAWGQKRNNLSDINTFVGNSDYVESLAGKSSLGILALAEYNLNKNWKAVYEYDQIAFDRKYVADRFAKHGLGLRWGFLNEAEIEIRYEKNIEGRSEDPNLNKNNDAILTTLHAWF